MKNESTLEISEKLVAIIYMETKYLELICSRIITSWVISSRRRWKRDERALRSEEARIGGGKRAIMAVIGEECLWESLLWKTRRRGEKARRRENARWILKRPPPQKKKGAGRKRFWSPEALLPRLHVDAKNKKRFFVVNADFVTWRANASS